MPASPAPSARRPDSGRGRRLLVYVTGLLIGVMLLGFFKARSAREAALRDAAIRESQARAPGGSASAPGDTTNPADAGGTSQSSQGTGDSRAP